MNLTSKMYEVNLRYSATGQNQLKYCKGLLRIQFCADFFYEMYKIEEYCVLWIFFLVFTGVRPEIY